jgi:hypothetical protein
LKDHFRHLNFSTEDDICCESLHCLRNIPRERFVLELNRLRDYCQQVVTCRGAYAC